MPVVRPRHSAAPPVADTAARNHPLAFSFQPSNGKIKFTVELNLGTGICQITPQDPLPPSPAATPHPAGPKL